MNPAEIAQKAGCHPSYVHRVVQGKQKAGKRLIPYLNLLDGASRKMYFEQRHKGLRQHFKVLQAQAELVGYHHLAPTEIVIEIPTTKPIAVCNSADWHIGQPVGVDYHQLEADVETWAVTRGLFTAFGGDGWANLIQPSKVGSSQNQAPISVQMATYALIVKRVAGKTIYISTGNHNYWSTLATGEDWDSELSQRLKVVYTKHAAKIHLKVGRITYPILRMHKGRFNSSFNLTHSCKQYQRMYFPDARVVVIEHQHIGDIEQYRYAERECVAIRTGTYATYDDYALQSGFFGAHVCNPTVVFYPDRDHLVGFKDMEDALIYLRAVRGGA